MKKMFYILFIYSFIICLVSCPTIETPTTTIQQKSESVTTKLKKGTATSYNKDAEFNVNTLFRTPVTASNPSSVKSSFDVVTDSIKYFLSVMEIGISIFNPQGGESNSVIKFFEGIKTRLNRMDIKLNELLRLSSEILINTEKIEYKLDQIINQITLAEYKSVLHSKIINDRNLYRLNTDYVNEIMDTVNADYLDEQEKEEVVIELITDWASTIVNGNNAYISAFAELELIKNCGQLSIPMVDVYDVIAANIYAWEHEGYDFRNYMRSMDLALTTQCFFLLLIYYNHKSLSEKNIPNLVSLKSSIGDIIKSRPVVTHEGYICQIQGVPLTFTGKVKQINYYNVLYSYSHESPMILYMMDKDNNIRNSGVKERIFLGARKNQNPICSISELNSHNHYKYILDFYHNTMSLYDIFATVLNIPDKDKISHRYACVLTNENTFNFSEDPDTFFISGVDMVTKKVELYNKNTSNSFNLTRDYILAKNTDGRLFHNYAGQSEINDPAFPNYALKHDIPIGIILETKK